MELLMLIAVLPPLYLVWRVYQKDRLEREPVSLIVKLLGAGGLVTFAALLLETLLSFLPDGLPYWPAKIVENFIVVALVEELCKFSVGRALTWKNREFNFTFDGVVYMTTASLGFALVENVEYAFTYGFRTAVVRAFTAIVMHAVFGIFMGCYYGLARLQASRGMKKRSVFTQMRGIAAAVFAHGAYDLCASQSSLAFSAAYILIIVAMGAVALKRVSEMQKNDTYIPYEGYNPGDRGSGMY